MPIKELSKVYQTDDGKIHATRLEAEHHQNFQTILDIVRAAMRDAQYDDPRRYSNPCEAGRMYSLNVARRLADMGFTAPA